MTVVLAINSVSDIYIDDTNNLAMLFGNTSNEDGIEAVEQACQTASLAQLGEMVLFTTQGMPALQSVFNSTPNLSVYQTALVAAIENVPGVIAVQSIVFTNTQNVLSYTATIESQYGETYING